MAQEQNPANPADHTPLEQRALANLLAHHMVRLRAAEEHDLFVQKVLVHDEAGHVIMKPLSVVLEDLISLVWPDNATWPTDAKLPLEIDNQRRRQLMDDLKSQSALIETLKDRPELMAELKGQKDIQFTVIDVMAHAGQLHQMAGLLARESFLRGEQRPESIDRVLFRTKTPDKKDALKKAPLTAKGAEAKPEKVLRYATAEEAVAALGEPRFEMTFTGHPTNTNSIASMKLQRTLAAELVKRQSGVPNTAEEALKAFAKAPMLPHHDAAVTPLTVQEETDTMLYFLGNTYEDLPRIYGNFDDELKKNYPDGYRPSDLKLGFEFHSWGSSGDKDGNKKVNGDTTLAAVSAHRTAILGRYAKELDGIDIPLKQDLLKAAETLAEVNGRLQATLKANGNFTPEEFAAYSAEVKDAMGSLDQKKLEAELVKASESGTTVEKRKTVNLLRRVRTFGFSFGHIEYRETAEEYERVVASLVPEYGALYAPVQDALDALKRENATLDDLKKDADVKALAEVTQKITAIEEESHKQTPHMTVVTDELAALHAERDALQETAGVKAYGAQANEVKQAAAQLAAAKDAFGEKGEERQAVLNAVLQDPARLKQVTEQVQQFDAEAGKAYDATSAGPIAYQTLKRMQLARDFPDMIQKNVLAECGGAANMLEALLLQHAVAKDGVRATLGIVPLFEEHATLAAAPAIIHSALANPVYQQHLQDVHAVQGLPVAQQVQLAHSDNAKRAGVPASRALVFKAHDAIRKMMDSYNRESGHAPVGLQFFEGGSQSDAYRGGVRSISAGIKEFGLLDFTKMTYQGGDLLNYFNLPYSTQRLLTKSICTQAQGLAERAETPVAERKPLLSATSERIINGFDELKSSYIDHLFNNPRYVSFLNKIGYAFSGMFGNLSSRAPSRDGKSVELTDINTTRAIGISETLQHAEIAATWVGVSGIEDILKKHVQFSEVPEKRHEMYKKSAVFRDIVDRMMYGLMRSDLNYVAETSKYHDGEHPLMPQFRQEYAEAFKLCMEAYTGQPIKRFVKADLTDPQVLGNVIKDDYLRTIIKREVYPHVMDTLGDQQRFVELAHNMDSWDIGEAGANKEQLRLQHYLIHNMMDTVHHGRLPLVDDPSYAKRYCTANKIVRPWVDVPPVQQRSA